MCRYEWRKDEAWGRGIRVAYVRDCHGEDRVVLNLLADPRSNLHLLLRVLGTERTSAATPNITKPIKFYVHSELTRSQVNFRRINLMFQVLFSSKTQWDFKVVWSWLSCLVWTPPVHEVLMWSASDLELLTSCTHSTSPVPKRWTFLWLKPLPPRPVWKTCRVKEESSCVLSMACRFLLSRLVLFVFITARYLLRLIFPVEFIGLCWEAIPNMQRYFYHDEHHAEVTELLREFYETLIEMLCCLTKFLVYVLLWNDQFPVQPLSMLDPHSVRCSIKLRLHCD